MPGARIEPTPLPSPLVSPTTITPPHSTRTSVVPDESPPIVSFSFTSSNYFANEDNKRTKVFLSRLPASTPGKKTSEAHVETAHDVILKCRNVKNSFGVKVKEGQALVAKFQPGDTVIAVEVPVPDDEKWQVLTEFKVTLDNITPSSGVVIELGEATITCVDDDFWPSNRGGDLLREIVKDKAILDVASDVDNRVAFAISLKPDFSDLIEKAKNVNVDTIRESFKSTHMSVDTIVQGAGAIVHSADAAISTVQHAANDAITLIKKTKVKTQAQARLATHTNQLVVEFWKERWVARGKKAKITAFLMATKAVVAVAQLYLYKIIINCIRQSDLFSLGFVLLGSILMDVYCHYADRKILDYRGRSGTRKDLRLWLARKWLTLSGAQQEKIGKYRYMNVASFDVEEIVKKVWWNMFRLIYVAMWILFAIIAVAELGRSSGFYLIWVFAPLAFVLLNVLFQAATYRGKVLIRQKHEQKWTEAFGFVTDSSLTHRRKEAANNFSKVYTNFYNNHRASEFVKLDFIDVSKFGARLSLWGFVFMAAYWIIEDNSMDIGTFTAILSILKAYTKIVSDLSIVLVEIQRGQVSLERASKLLNMPDGREEIGEAEEIMQLRAAAMRLGVQDKELGISLPEWALKDQTDYRSRSTLDMRKVRTEATANGFRVLLGELLERHQETVASVLLQDSIQLQNVSFAYPSREFMKGTSLGPNVISCFSRTFAEGACYNFVGFGKSTMLRLLAQNNLVPQSGTISLPQNVRKRVFVPRVPVLAPGLLLDNALALVKERDECMEEEAWKLLDSMGFDTALLRKDIFCSGSNLNIVEVKKIALTRAILSKAEVLVLDRITESMNEVDADKVKNILLQWLRVEEEGGRRRTILAAGLEWGNTVNLDDP